MATTWIVAADESRAKVLQVTDQQEHLTEIQNLENPSGRLQDREMQTDAEPRLEHSAGVFAREVGRYLDQARLQHRYDQLVLVAPPKFLGALRKELHKEVEKLVADELPKDLSWLNARELERYFAKGKNVSE